MHAKTRQRAVTTFHCRFLPREKARIDHQRRSRHRELDHDAFATCLENRFPRPQRLPGLFFMQHAVHHLSHLLAPPALAIRGEMNRIAVTIRRVEAVQSTRHRVVRPYEMNRFIRIRRHELRLTCRTECLIREHRQLALLPRDRAQFRRPLPTIRDELIAIPLQSFRTRNLRIPTRRHDATRRPAIALALHPIERLDAKIRPQRLRPPRIIQTRSIIPASMPSRLRCAFIHRQIRARKLLNLPPALSCACDEVIRIALLL